ncbi:MAG: hypothetical protein AB1896_17440 [Thermodesulfobacteriota bacterium]
MREVLTRVCLAGLILVLGCSTGPESKGVQEMEMDLSGEYDQVGFRGIAWLTELTDVEGLAPVEAGGAVKIYRRQGDLLVVGGHHLNGIYYGFCQDRFCAAAMAFADPEVGRTLYEYVTAVHGEPDQTLRLPDEGVLYVWDGALVEISLELKKEGALKYRYKALFREIEE